MSESLYRAARADKQTIMVAGVGHEDALPAGGQILARATQHTLSEDAAADGRRAGLGSAAPRSPSST